MRKVKEALADFIESEVNPGDRYTTLRFEHAKWTMIIAALRAPSPAALDPVTVKRILANFDRQRVTYRERADNPKYNEQQKEIWAALSNEKADDLDYLRRALLAQPTPAGKPEPVAKPDHGTVSIQEGTPSHEI